MKLGSRIQGQRYRLLAPGRICLSRHGSWTSHPPHTKRSALPQAGLFMDFRRTNACPPSFLLIVITALPGQTSTRSRVLCYESSPQKSFLFPMPTVPSVTGHGPHILLCSKDEKRYAGKQKRKISFSIPQISFMQGRTLSIPCLFLLQNTHDLEACAVSYPS